MASRPARRVYVCVCVLAFIWAAVTFVQLRRSKAQAQKLTQALEVLDVGSSSNADVQRISKEFSQYEVASEDRYGVHEVNFEIAETSVVRLAVHSGAILHAGIGTQDGKVVAVGVMFERQVSGGKLAAIISEAREQSGTCQNPYCVGNPIGKRFIFSGLDMRATPEQKRRAFDLNLKLADSVQWRSQDLRLVSRCLGGMEGSAPWRCSTPPVHIPMSLSCLG